jgi:hypothetical protein
MAAYLIAILRTNNDLYAADEMINILPELKAPNEIANL